MQGGYSRYGRPTVRREEMRSGVIPGTLPQVPGSGFEEHARNYHPPRRGHGDVLRTWLRRKLGPNPVGGLSDPETRRLLPRAMWSAEWDRVFPPEGHGPEFRMKCSRQWDEEKNPDNIYHVRAYYNSASAKEF